MRFFIFIMLACCAVSCDDNSNNYYIVQVPADDPPVKTFNVYWNVPTMQCKSRKVLFENLYEKYGIIQNADDNFRGEKITILYEPGLFPAIFKNESSGKYRFRNGGIPQEGDLQQHLMAFRKDMDDIIPDANFSGVAIIDFESWRPIFRQNFGTLVPYKDVSYEIERKLHPWWPTVWIQSEAKRRFQEAARKFMQTTISVAKQMRPKAIWGYYGFPHCFNMAQSNLVEQCSSDVIQENDQTYWLWDESTALFPSIYRAHDLSPSQLAAMIRGRVGEAARVRRRNSVILPYFWFKYRDSGFITQNDLSAIFKALYKSDASGFVIWGSSNDVNTLEKCVNLQNYIENVFGPAVALYTKRLNKHKDEVTETPEELNNSSEVNYSTTYNDDIYITIKPNVSDINESTPNYHELKDKLDPEMIWTSPTNVTVDLSSNIDEELLKKRYSQIVPNDTDGNFFSKNIIFNILMSSLITLKNVSHIDDGKDNNITTENNNLIIPEPIVVNSNIQTDNPLRAENVTSYDNRQYYRKEDSTISDNNNESSTTSEKNISEVNETSSTNTLYTSTDSIVLYTSTTESLDTNSKVSSNYNETTQRDVENITSKNLPSESTTIDNKFLTFDNIEKDSKDEYFILLKSDKSLVDKSTQKTDWTYEDITSLAPNLSTKQYVDSTTDKMLENENYTEQETISSTDIF